MSIRRPRSEAKLKKKKKKKRAVGQAASNLVAVYRDVSKIKDQELSFLHDKNYALVFLSRRLGRVGCRKILSVCKEIVRYSVAM